MKNLIINVKKQIKTTVFCLLAIIIGSSLCVVPKAKAAEPTTTIAVATGVIILADKIITFLDKNGNRIDATDRNSDISKFLRKCDPSLSESKANELAKKGLDNLNDALKKFDPSKNLEGKAKRLTKWAKKNLLL